MSILNKNLFKSTESNTKHELNLLKCKLEKLEIDRYILTEKLKQKGLSEIGYAFWYYILNAVVASIFVVGINEISVKAKYPALTKAILWIIFISAFLPLLTTSVAYYSQYFVISNHITDKNYPQLHNKEYFAQLDDEKFFPLFHSTQIKKNNIKNFKTTLKNWFEYAKKPEILCIRAKSWSVSACVIVAFSFIQFVCYKGIKSFFVNLPQKQATIMNVVLNIVVSIALTIMFVMIKHVADRLFWADHSTSVKKEMIKENLCKNNSVKSMSTEENNDPQMENIVTDQEKKEKNTECPSSLLFDCNHTNVNIPFSKELSFY